MPLWLTEDPSTVYLILALIVLVLLAAFFLTKLAKYLIAAGVVVLVALGVMLIDFLIVSDNERIENRLQYMAEKSEANDMDEVFKHVSRDFNYNGMTRDAFRGHATGRLHQYKIDDIVLWDFHPEGTKDGVATVSFHAKIKGDWSGGGEFFRVRAHLVKEEGDWKLRGFQLFNPVVQGDQEIPLP